MYTGYTLVNVKFGCLNNSNLGDQDSNFRKPRRARNLQINRDLTMRKLNCWMNGTRLNWWQTGLSSVQ